MRTFPYVDTAEVVKRAPKDREKNVYVCCCVTCVADERFGQEINMCQCGACTASQAFNRGFGIIDSQVTSLSLFLLPFYLCLSFSPLSNSFGPS